jgi:hypothetical protein
LAHCCRGFCHGHFATSLWACSRAEHCDGQGSFMASTEDREWERLREKKKKEQTGDKITPFSKYKVLSSSLSTAKIYTSRAHLPPTYSISAPPSRFHHSNTIKLWIYQWINLLMRLQPSLSSHFPKAHQLINKPLGNICNLAQQSHKLHRTHEVKSSNKILDQWFWCSFYFSKISLSYEYSSINICSSLKIK